MRSRKWQEQGLKLVFQDDSEVEVTEEVYEVWARYSVRASFLLMVLHCKMSRVERRPSSGWMRCWSPSATHRCGVQSAMARMVSAVRRVAASHENGESSEPAVLSCWIYSPLLQDCPDAIQEYWRSLEAVKQAGSSKKREHSDTTDATESRKSVGVSFTFLLCQIIF